MACEPAREPPKDLAPACRELSERFGVRLTVILVLPRLGEVVADTTDDPSELDNHGDRPEVQEAIAGRTGRSVRASITRHETLMYLAVPLRRKGQIVAVVRTSLPTAPLAAAQRAVYAEIAAVGLLAVFAMAAAALLVVARPIVRALQDVRRGAERFARGDWKYRLPDNSWEEIGRLSESLNSMAAQLDDRIQRILRQQSEHQAVLSSMEEGVMAVDRAGTVLSVNEPCAELLGVEPERLRGRSVYEVLRKPDLLKFIEKCAGQPQVAGRGLALPQPRGALAARPRHGAARRPRAEDRRARRAARRHAAAAAGERPPRLRGQRLARVADADHVDQGLCRNAAGRRLRGPRQHGAFFGNCAPPGKPPGGDHQRPAAAPRVERSGEDQRIETGAEPLSQVVKVARETCEKKAHDKSIAIVVDSQEDIVARINGPLLEQAVINLIDNAIKYSDSGAVVQVTVAREGDFAVIRVIDNGCGIAANHVPRLFERFYRVDKARSRELGGTGLGLAIVKHIAAAHQGTVHVESVVGRGSTFTLRLPLGTQAFHSEPAGDELQPAAEDVA